MPYTTNPVPDSYTPSQQLPQHLDHKPVYALPYQEFDGTDSTNTDVRYLSVGIAQYNPDEVSIKTMRYTGVKWTRQAEELPLHRIIDMTLFLAKVLFDADNDEVHIPSGTFLNQQNSIHIIREQRSYGELASYAAFLMRHSQLYRDRLNVLLNVLQELKQAGRI